MTTLRLLLGARTVVHDAASGAFAVDFFVEKRMGAADVVANCQMIQQMIQQFVT